MAMTLSELESAYTALQARLTQIERLLKSAVSLKQLNEVTLVMQSDIDALRTDLTSLTTRVGTTENGLANLI